jgi:tetratricopeptide (TPR) repeat protein
MRGRSESDSRPLGRGSLWAYNIRILLGNTYWLIVTPLAAAQLVVFWNMATATSLTAARATLTMETVAAILAAFLCAHALAPEQDGVGELVFVRPVSVERVLLLRLGAIFAFVLIVLVPGLIVYKLVVHSFSIWLALLGSLPSMLLLSALAMAVASATRQPLLGLATAGGFWAIDLAVGSYFNPLVSLHGLASYLDGRAMGEQWVANKLVLLTLGVLLYLWNRSTLGRPAAPRKARVIVKSVLAVVVVLVCYVAAGAVYKVAYGVRHEREMGLQARLWYQQQFGGYGPLPVARLFGPAFALYLEAQGPGASGMGWGGANALFGRTDMGRLRRLVREYPNSMWADNAQLDIAVFTSRGPAAVPWLAVSYQEGKPEPERRLIEDSVEAAAAEFEALAERYPRSPFAPLALSQRSEGALRLLDFEMARSTYEQLVRGYSHEKEAYRAGVALSALHLWEGKAAEALEAANVAVKVATWDTQADALVAAARATQQLGQREEARGLFQSAWEAAEAAKARNVRNEKSPTGLSKLLVFERADVVIAACRDALATDPSAALRAGLAPRPEPSSSGVPVSGRVVRGERGVSGVRVALGASPDPLGFPSPFLAGPAYESATDQKGVYRLASVAPGEYRVLALAFPVRQSEGEWGVAGVSLPVRVAGAPVAVPAAQLAFARPEPLLRTRPPQTRGGTQPGAGGGRRGGRTTRQGGGGSRRSRGSRNGRGEAEGLAGPGGRSRTHR